MNFLDHTLETLSDFGRTVDDIVWIGTDEIEITWDEFSLMAEDEEDLDSGFAGLIAVPRDLKIVGKDWWMDLETIDSIEDDDQIGWVHREMPQRPLRFIHEQDVEDRLNDADVKEFRIIFGDSQFEYADSVYREPYETTHD